MEGGISWIKYFQIEGSSLKTRQAKFSKWLAGSHMNASSVIRVNRIMHSRAGD